MDMQTLSTARPAARPKNRWIISVFIVLFLFGLALIAMRLLLLQGLVIPSESMSPTLRLGDRLYATRDHYSTHEPRRFELVVFQAPSLALSLLGQQDVAGHPTFYVKRVIGLPGDHLRIVANEGVFINGKLLPEPYVEEKPNYDFPYFPNGEPAVISPQVRAQLQPYLDGDHTLRVPPGCYFVLGDNRTQSHDSHIWGLLPRNALCGRVFYRYLPLSRIGPVR